MDNKDIRIAMSEMQENAILNAYAVIAVLGLKEDEISESKAHELYGRSWIKTRTKAGLLHYTRQGDTIRSAKVYSRFEIESLKRSEKCIAEKYKQAAETLQQLETHTDTK